MANLYQIRAEIENFAAEVDEETGEFLNADAWDELNLSYEEKIENTACYIKNLRADISAIEAEIKLLKERAAAKEKKAAGLEKMLNEHLCGQKFESARCVVSYRKSTAVEVEDISLLPEELLTIKTKVDPNKAAITKLLKEGQTVTGCTLVEKLNMNIK
ncbi:MAG: siphovirus Gp157 family protein [Kiritimatiellae bacterium]|nr:siphovirus Gp157 family protein [Kiritimatiellia bacterium]